jgi:hypothetical protein
MIKDVTALFGYQQIVGLAAATSLTVPSRDLNGRTDTPTIAVIIPETQGVRWRDDGVPPTATVGMPLNVGAVLVYDGDIKAIQFFQQAATATLNVSYYK